MTYLCNEPNYFDTSLLSNPKSSVLSLSNECKKKWNQINVTLSRKNLTCSSWAGFQLTSYMMTLFAAVRFRPIPPARVEIKNINIVSFCWNWSTRSCLLLFFVLPSRRMIVYPCSLQNCSMKSRAVVEWENRRTRSLSLWYFCSRELRTVILPESAWWSSRTDLPRT